MSKMSNEHVRQSEENCGVHPIDDPRYDDVDAGCSTIIMIQCPDCAAGKLSTLATGKSRPTPCKRCNGVGLVDNRMPDWIKRGRKMKLKRVEAKPYVTVWQEAKRRKMDSVTLMRMEDGIIEPIE